LKAKDEIANIKADSADKEELIKQWEKQGFTSEAI
jgi:hypothetical protein